MNIKKLLFFLLTLILIPYFIISIFISDDEIKFYYNSNNVVRVYQEKKDKIITVPLEKYVIGVVSGEMPASFHIEALKAQTVASRTYVLYQIEHNKNKEYDVYDSENSQVYLEEGTLKGRWGNDYVKYMNKIKTAVLSTLGEYLVYNGEIIDSLFFSSSAGYTENSEDVFQESLPYLRSVESKWDVESPSYENIITLSLEEFYKKLNIDYSAKLEAKILKTTSTGRISEISINNNKFTGQEIRKLLNLKSSFASIQQKNNQIIINTKGSGHGVGMSQYGANGMANEGYKYNEILKHYYTGVEIKK